MDFSLDHAERLQASAGTYWVYVNQTMQVTPPYNSTIYTSLTILPGVIPFYWRAGITLLVEKVILNFVSINFHRKALAERLAEKKGGLGNRRRKKVVKSVTIHQVGEAIGQVALEHSQLHRRGEYGSLDSARKLAKNLFISLSDAHPPRDDLIVQDFEPYFRTTADSHTAFEVFGKDGDSDITKKEMREAAQTIYKEREALVASVKDTRSALATLDTVLLGLGLILVVFICLLIFNRADTLSSLVPRASIRPYLRRYCERVRLGSNT